MKNFGDQGRKKIVKKLFIESVHIKLAMVVL